jgi:hypothetical protein
MRFKNQEYYEQVKISLKDSVKPFFNKSNWLVYACVAIFSVVIAPFITMRRSHVMLTSLEIYFHQVIFFAGALAVIMLPLLWLMQFKPYFEIKDGHYYTGKFEIINKKQFLGYCFLSLFPGKRNWIKVSQKVFYSIGETIELKRSAFGSINSIKKITSIRQRITMGYFTKRKKERLKVVS